MGEDGGPSQLTLSLEAWTTREGQSGQVVGEQLPPHLSGSPGGHTLLQCPTGVQDAPGRSSTWGFLCGTRDGRPHTGIRVLTAVPGQRGRLGGLHMGRPDLPPT